MSTLLIYRYLHPERPTEALQEVQKNVSQITGSLLDKICTGWYCVLQQNWRHLFWRKEIELLVVRYWFEIGGKLKDNQYSVKSYKASTVKRKWILKWCLFECSCFTQPLISETQDQIITEMFSWAHCLHLFLSVSI